MGEARDGQPPQPPSPGVGLILAHRRTGGQAPSAGLIECPGALLCSSVPREPTSSPLAGFRFSVAGRPSFAAAPVQYLTAHAFTSVCGPPSVLLLLAALSYDQGWHSDDAGVTGPYPYPVSPASASLCLCHPAAQPGSVPPVRFCASMPPTGRSSVLGLSPSSVPDLCL